MNVHFAHPLPWWALLAVLALAGAVAVYAYRRPAAPLTTRQRATLSGLRWVTLAALIVFLMRPVVPTDARGAATAVVGVLLDTSRSMGLRDGGETTRLQQAVDAARRLVPALERQYRVEVFSAGDGLAPATLGDLAATGRRTDLAGSIRAAAERLAGRNAAGLVVLSDGAEAARTSRSTPLGPERVPVVTIGVGSPDVRVDREVRAVTIGPSALDASLVELTATAFVYGAGTPVRMRLLQDRRLVEVREVHAPRDGSPIVEIFRVAPDRTTPAVYRVELDEDPAELTHGNNAVDVLVTPPGRRRRVLVLEGAPGFEHTFLRRAWQQDPSLEVDSVVRKGRNDQGAATYYVQAASGRATALATGFPADRAALFAYDAVVLANLEPESLGREALRLVNEFVEVRGGGMLMFGARSFTPAAIAGSPIEPLVPVDLNDRGSNVAHASSSPNERFKVSVTGEGARHPIMRLPARADGKERGWSVLPPLAGAVNLGEPRAGASILAVTTSATGRVVPLVAVQRFGAGRTMIFGGEASWRWRMLMPSEDRSYEAFWRQAARWLAGEAPEPLGVTIPAGVPLGESVQVTVTPRSASFERVPDAEVSVTVQAPAREPVPLEVATSPDGSARVAAFDAREPGVYRVQVEGRHDERVLGRSEHLVLAGGSDPELMDPRLNQQVLQRIADDSAGRYLPVSEAASAGSVLQALRAGSRPAEYRDAWHTGWSFALVLLLLGGEWALRRRWGLR